MIDHHATRFIIRMNSGNFETLNLEMKPVLSMNSRALNFAWAAWAKNKPGKKKSFIRNI